MLVDKICSEKIEMVGDGIARTIVELIVYKPQFVEGYGYACSFELSGINETYKAFGDSSLQALQLALSLLETVLKMKINDGFSLFFLDGGEYLI